VSPSNAPKLVPSARHFSSCPTNQASTAAQRRKYRDPYALAQARARKAANLSRQEVLKREREAALGDPVRGAATPFVESFDRAQPLPNEDINPAFTERPQVRKESVLPNVDNNPYLKHFMRQGEIETQFDVSKALLQPVPESISNSETMDIETAKRRELQRAKEHDHKHERAREAIARIVSLQNGSSEDRRRANIQRCVHTFGRHKTDTILPPKATARRTGSDLEATVEEPKSQEIKRAGPDTGSSEVQIAILTAKIRSLANGLETRGRKDKVGKRDLRLLVHRRQKLLKYLYRKERGGPRWQHCIETLGLTDGTWKGEISL
jgi:ribosomal protein S15